MIALGLAGLAFLVFVARVIVEPRSFGNAVLLGMALALGALGVVENLARAGRPGNLLLVLILLAVVVGPLLLGGYLVANGVTMIWRESLRPGNLLSLAAGAAIFVVIALDVVADRAGDYKLSLFDTVLNLLFGYVSFLLVSYVCYAFVYGLLASGLVTRLVTRAGGADFVLVLGAGLRRDGRVPPLLASRLERGREVWAALDRQAADFRPVLIVSGGKGSDERCSEASAMAAYLVERGFPAGRLLLEERSRTTEENLAFSKVIIDDLRPGARVTVVTSDFHAFRAALLARRLGIPGQVTGARVAGYYRPSALLREFAAVFMRYRVINLLICAVLVAGPVGLAAASSIGTVR